MCHLIYLSTNSDQDLATLPSDLFSFVRPSKAEIEQMKGLLRHQNVWYLTGAYGGCSCHFRHLLWESTSLGFGDPEDWFPEDEDDIASTHAVYDAISDLVKQGYKVDLVDQWSGDPVETSLEVSLCEVTRTKFRFWAGHRFELVS